jgi:hypothetical protein
LALEMNDRTIALYELSTASPRRIFGQPVPLSKDSLKGTSKGGGGVLNVQVQPGSRIAISPDGKSLAAAGQDRLVHVWDISTGAQRAAFKGGTANVNAVTFSPDSTLIASAGADTTALIWDLAKVNRPAAVVKTLKPGELDQRWQALGASDAIKAFAAICDLVGSPKEAVDWIKEKVQPAVPAGAKRIEELIGQVDDPQFKVREQAITELYKIGEPTVPALETALAGKLALETKTRLEEIRSRLTGNLLQGERLRLFRAVEVLERIGTPDARQALQALAEGAPGALVTTSARAAISRKAIGP